MSTPGLVFGLALLMLACVAPTVTAKAQVTNGSFETGDQTGWSGAGDVTVEGSFGATLPSDGSFMAVVSSDSGVNIPDNTLESFLGIPPGTLDGMGNGDAIDGSAVHQFFFANSGEHYAFDWDFVTNEPTPSANNDFAVVVIDGVAVELADTGAEFPFPAQFGPNETGFHASCFTAQSTGDVDFGVGVVDVGNSTTESWVLVDNLRQVTDFDEDGIPDPCDFDCPPVARGDCRSAGKSTLLIKDSSDDSKDQLVWKWAKGQPTQYAELGDPTDTTEYRLCLYAGSASALVRQIEVPAGGPPWQPAGDKGYRYKDKLGQSDGVTKVLLKGSAANKSKVLLKGAGSDLPDLPAQTLPFDPEDYPITVELINNETGVCFGSTFDEGDVKKNTTDQFKAKAF